MRSSRTQLISRYLRLRNRFIQPTDWSLALFGLRRGIEINGSYHTCSFAADEPKSALQGRRGAISWSHGHQARRPTPRPTPHAEDRAGERLRLRTRPLFTRSARPWLPEPALLTVLVLSQTAPVLLIVSFALHAVVICYSLMVLFFRVLFFAGRIIIIQYFRCRVLFTKQVGIPSTACTHQLHARTLSVVTHTHASFCWPCLRCSLTHSLTHCRCSLSPQARPRPRERRRPRHCCRSRRRRPTHHHLGHSHHHFRS